MIHETIKLKERYDVQGGELTVLAEDFPFDRPEKWSRPAVVVVAGGGYSMVSRREAEPVALAFLARGFQTFLLTYLCADSGARYPEQLRELAFSVDLIRKNATKWHVDAANIFAVGFSAGGHLVGCLSTDHTSAQAGDTCKLTAAALCYPVISAEYGHVGSFENLLGSDADAELLQKVALDKLVSEKTAPAFLWCTAEDTVVPPLNSLKYAEALSKYKIPFELHVYPRGHHGLSVCDAEINPPADYLSKNAHWLDDCADFFRSVSGE